MEQNSSAKTQHKSRAQEFFATSASNSSSNAKSVPTGATTSLLKPALVNSTNVRYNNQNVGRSHSYKTPSPSHRKSVKTIRWDLGSANTSKDDSWLSPTPPPKDFKRMGKQRATMLPPRNERCMSTAITQKELQEAFLFGGYLKEHKNT